MNMTKRILGKWLARKGIEAHRRGPTPYLAILNSSKQLHLFIRANGTCYAEVHDIKTKEQEYAIGLSNICKLVNLHTA